MTFTFSTSQGGFHWANSRRDLHLNNFRKLSFDWYRNYRSFEKISFLTVILFLGNLDQVYEFYQWSNSEAGEKWTHVGRWLNWWPRSSHLVVTQKWIGLSPLEPATTTPVSNAIKPTPVQQYHSITMQCIAMQQYHSITVSLVKLVSSQQLVWGCFHINKTLIKKLFVNHYSSCLPPQKKNEWKLLVKKNDNY